MSYAAPIEICQAAITRIGGQIVTSLSDGSPPAVIFNANYENMVKARLSMHTWSFASMPIALTYQGEREVGRLRHAYVIPPQALRVHWVGKQKQRLNEWAIDDGKILVEFEDDYEALISTRTSESDWNSDFQEALIIQIEALFLSGLMRQPEAARLRYKDADMAFRLAMVADKRQRTGAVALRDGTLIAAWTGR